MSDIMIIMHQIQFRRRPQTDAPPKQSAGFGNLILREKRSSDEYRPKSAPFLFQRVDSKLFICRPAWQLCPYGLCAILLGPGRNPQTYNPSLTMITVGCETVVCVAVFSYKRCWNAWTLRGNELWRRSVCIHCLSRLLSFNYFTWCSPCVFRMRVYVTL